MSRRDGIDIAGIIDQCKEYKDSINSLKKLSSPLEDQIKQYAVSNNLETIKTDKWQAKVTITPNQEFNEAKAVDILKAELPEEIYSSCIKTKEYIDEDALEKLIYNGTINEDLLACCITDKPATIRLTINQRKD